MSMLCSTSAIITAIRKRYKEKRKLKEQNKQKQKKERKQNT